MSTVKHSVVGMRGYGHGCAMAGGEKLSAPVKRRLEYGNEREEEGEWKSSSQRIW